MNTCQISSWFLRCRKLSSWLRSLITAYGTFFEHTCSYAWWTIIHHFMSICMYRIDSFFRSYLFSMYAAILQSTRATQQRLNHRMCKKTWSQNQNHRWGIVLCMWNRSEMTTMYLIREMYQIQRNCVCLLDSNFNRKNPGLSISSPITTILGCRLFAVIWPP